VAESRAGAPADRELGSGEAIAISTGAMVPQGADAVIRVEDTDGGSGRVEVRVAVDPGHDIRRAGEDIGAGDAVLGPGTELGPAELGVLASVGVGEVTCARRPKVTLLTTGDELQEPGQPLRPGAIRNSNTHTVSALVARAGAELVAAEIVPDAPARTREALERALAGDIAVVCGGVSVGEHDHVRPALDELDVEQVFWGVSLRPGKPTYFGVTPPRSSASRPVSATRPGTLVFGLPGNPVSAMVTFILFVRPAIRQMLGLPDDARRATAQLDEEYPTLPARTQAVRCGLELRDDGWHAHPTKAQGSHILTSMLGADALAIVPPGGGPLPAGTRVEVELLP
jgi:molybdopterin molybdotransferase